MIKKEKGVRGAIVFANAKINIGLSVLGKRADGFHNIETVMYPVNIFDVIEWHVSTKFSIETYGLKIYSNGKGGENLIEKAYKLLTRQFDIPPLKICLLKNIPAGSGLGGGSADAVFFIKSINRAFGLKMDNTDMEKISLETGSDCPFFVKNIPAFVSGRGEKITGLNHFLKGYRIIVVFPDIKTDTGDLYGKIQKYGTSLNYEKIAGTNPAGWSDFVFNDFESILFEKYHRLGEIKDKLYKSGALYCSLTGSGSAVYGIFKEEPASWRNSFPGNYLTFKLKM